MRSTETISTTGQASFKARVLVVHNRYKVPGGEDAVAQTEIELLRRRGHEVEVYWRDNHEIDARPRLAVVRDSFWAPRAERDVATLLADFRPDVVHVHNLFPLISPSIFRSARAAGVPVVATLHNFRLLCPQAMFLRDGRVCEDCLGKAPWRAVRHRCYRDSAAQSAVVASMTAVHRALGLWEQGVARFIALNQFCKDKFIAGGLPGDRIDVKGNVVADPGRSPPVARRGGLFVGRLSAEKGVAVLRLAAERGDAEIAVVGDGPERGALEGARGLRLLGRLARPEVDAAMQAASFLVLPSLCYESFPLVIVEAFANGLPVICSRHGPMAELITEGETGLLFEPGSAQDLARVLDWAHAHPDAMQAMGARARQTYDTRFDVTSNYETLVSIYAKAIEQRSRGG